MSALLLNTMIGLITSLLSGASVWLWERGRGSRVIRRKAAFFGLERGNACLIIMNDKYNKPGAVARNDVHTMVDIAILARELGSPVEIAASDIFNGSNGDRTEFCVGGPFSNSRTGGHLAAHVPGVRILPFGDGEDSQAIVVGGERFSWDRGHREYALIAKFVPTAATSPVFVICGQSSIANRAAISFLKREYRRVERSVQRSSTFCVVVRVDAIETYGFEAAALECDVSAAAFADSVQ